MIELGKGSNLFGKLKRRNVFRVGVAYLVVGWVLVQIAGSLENALSLPKWFDTVVVALLALGLPVALFLSWAYELTPEGVKKTTDDDASAGPKYSAGRKLDLVITGALVLAVIFLLADRQTLTPSPSEPVTAEAAAKSLTPSIAILPFTDLSPAGDKAYFADGLSEEILNVLAGVDALEVASRTSSFQFKGRDIGVPEIATALNVSFVLEGSVRRAGGTIRVTGQLIEAASDRHLWSATFDRELTTDNIFSIQDEIAKAIVGALSEELDLNAGMDAVDVTGGTANISAYDTFLEGRETFLGRGRVDDVVRSIALLESAVQIDPTFARAWLWLGAAYAVAQSWDVPDDRDTSSLAETAASRALELDPGLGFAQAVIGNAIRFRSTVDWDSSMSHLQRALEFDPGDATTHLWLASNYRDLGFFDLADAHYTRCLALEPRYLNCHLHKALNHRNRGESERAAEHTELALQLSRTLPALVDSFVNASRSSILRGDTFSARFIIALGAPNPADFPIEGWIEAIRDPGGDHSKTIDQVAAWLQGKNLFWRTQWELYLVLGAYDRVPTLDGYEPVPLIWLADFPAFRKSESFKRNVRALNMLPYWQKNGFPPQCRPLGDDDFECD